MFAKVIVDVPVKQTNRAYDYVVPAVFLSRVEVGSRVIVSFGSRILQGFVVSLFENSAMDISKLKPILHVIDLFPSLNSEMVALAHWIGQTYLCHEITALQAMLPTALKAKYEHFVSLSEDGIVKRDDLLSFPQQNEIMELLQKKHRVPLESLLLQFPQEERWIKHCIRTGRFIESVGIKNKIAKKTVLTLVPSTEEGTLRKALSQLSVKAKRQRQLLEFLLEHPEPIQLTELTRQQKISAEIVKSLVNKGLAELVEVEHFRDPYAQHTFIQTSPLPLTAEQKYVFGEISRAVQDNVHRIFLLHGVTGSGKTEVYLQSIKQCLLHKKEAIVLVPEISLTPQMVERFKGRFGDAVAVLHSRLSQGERYDEWRKIILKQVKVVIGARSAIFAPFTQLGLIIIDEEHETSYKQEESPKYHARDVAIERAKWHQASVVLGSATPSLESYYHAVQLKDYQLLTMRQRVEGRPLPPVQIIDMRDELKAGNRSMFSRALQLSIADKLLKQEQIVLLLNRRGYSTFVMCRTCGYTVCCPHCEIALTYHQSSKRLRCHYCGHTKPQLTLCPNCQSEHIRYFGTGTQKVEAELLNRFPGIRVIRMDVDTTAEKGAHEKWLRMFRERQADVLLGTQMVAKGLDFPAVTLVGVVSADTVLNLADFRAGERTFQLLTQVAGRAGRHNLPGEVIIQTYSPEHYSIQKAGHHDYENFTTEELKLRESRGYPPYCRLILITFSHEQIPLLVHTAEAFVLRLKELATDQGICMVAGSHAITSSNCQLEILGPAVSPHSRIKDRYRFQCMVKYRGETNLSLLISKTTSSFDEICRQHNLQISVDVDPQLLQ